MSPDQSAADDQLRQRLTPEQYEVTQCSATERAFTGIYWDHHEDGMYRCVVCDTALFDSTTKFDSGTGWPSFWSAAVDGAVISRQDTSYGMVREEALCAKCGAHLGHIFPDGPAPSGLRFCINSASLAFADRSAEGGDADADPRRPSA